MMEDKTEEELSEIIKAGSDAEREISRRRATVAEEIDRRLNAGDAFKADELQFAELSKCPCGELLAYPLKMSPMGYWDCSALLMRTAIQAGEPGAVTHTARLPFAFWKVK